MRGMRALLGHAIHLSSGRKAMKRTLVHVKPPKFPCNDCGVDVFWQSAIGIWPFLQHLAAAASGLGWNDNVCLACLEKTLRSRTEAGGIRHRPHVNLFQIAAATIRQADQIVEADAAANISRSGPAHR